MDCFLVLFPFVFVALGLVLFIGCGLCWHSDWSRLSFAGQKSREQALLFAHIPGFRRPDASPVPLRSGQSRAAERSLGASLC